jgi:hypothetical protein
MQYHTIKVTHVSLSRFKRIEALKQIDKTREVIKLAYKNGLSRDVLHDLEAVVRRRRAVLIAPPIVETVLVRGKYRCRLSLNDSVMDMEAIKQLVHGVRSQIHREREKLREEATDYEMLRKGIVKVHTEPGYFFKQHKLKKTNKVLQSKVPLDEDKHVGVEIEFCSSEDRDTFKIAFVDAGLDSNVQIKSDGSLRPDDGDHGHEICVLAKQNEIESVILRVCQVLAVNDAYVNKSCGLHVHMDMRQRDKHVAFNNLVACQNHLLAMVPKSRRTNQYCKRVRGRELNEFPRSRYKTINAASLRQHGTLEVRLHSGTTDAAKINNWIRILTYIVEAPKIDGTLRTVKGLARAVNMPQALTAYMENRIALFAPTTDASEEANAA